jgi:predicted nuclease of predicted toxin-antitoxin system
MKFLVDAQLPRNLAWWLAEAGHDALHTLDLPRKNRTTDAEVVERAVQDGRVVVSKDSDFVASYLLTGVPRLLLISTGNIPDIDLEQSLRSSMATIEVAFTENNLVEITREAMVIHE